MRKVSVRCQTANYDILIGKNIFFELGTLLRKKAKGSKVFIVSNPTVSKYFLVALKKNLKKSGFDLYTYKTPYGSEKDKSAKVLFRIWEAMGKASLERGSFVVALGGGVIGDVAGFAAATYMRGISVIQIPTTLLAQVDSAIGGKTAIDLPIAKNIVGAFHQPSLVLSDTMMLEKLIKTSAGRTHFMDSFSEVIKYGVIEDTILFDKLEVRAEYFSKKIKSGKLSSADHGFLEEIVWRSSKVKAEVVSRDEFETKGKRVMLNFGHTFAHGFEAAADFRLTHGRAVAMGMACAARLAVMLKLFKPSEEVRLLNLIKAFGLPVSPASLRLSMSRVMDSMARDKKKKSGKLRFVLPTRIGKTVLREGIKPSLIRKAILTSGISSKV